MVVWLGGVSPQASEPLRLAGLNTKVTKLFVPLFNNFTGDLRLIVENFVAQQ